MAFVERPIEVVDTLSPEQFNREYYRKKPVVIRKLAQDWPALAKWTPDYFRSVAGDQQVPLYDGSKADASKVVNEPDRWMKFSEYLDLIEREPTEWRIFAFNVLKSVPAVTSDFTNPTLTTGFLNDFPMLFFGGAGSKVFVHYDIDLPHLFHTHFIGRKRVLLFAPEASPYMYRLPFSIFSHEDMKPDEPDFERWPALNGLTRYETIMEHGDTLYMPSGWWHHMTYLSGSYSLTLRALDTNWLRKLHSVYNVIILRNLDNLGRKIWGPKWFDYKERTAIARTNALVGA
jgi:ribosomal protein L16 Arg81 hydroxylase